MSHRALLLLLASALLALPVAAQDAGEPDDAGDVPVVDAGDVDCTPRCDGEVLLFCDEGAEEPLVELDCSASGATCGLLSDAWGFDCLLPAGAACQPGYAGGLSRCEGSGTATLCCVADVCADPGASDDCRDFVPGAPGRPASGGSVPDDEEASSCFGLSGIPGLGLLLPIVFGLRRVRRRR